MKEELRPKGADKWLFYMAPVLSAAAAFAAFSVVPFGGETTLFGLLDDPLALEVTDAPASIAVGATALLILSSPLWLVSVTEVVEERVKDVVQVFERRRVEPHIPLPRWIGQSQHNRYDVDSVVG